MFQGEQDSPKTSSYEKWADYIERTFDAKAGQQPSRTEPYTIHRVPDSIRTVDDVAYEPKMLSIGPYHRSNPKLKAMEDHKWHCLRRVLRRYPERRLSDYLKEMELLEVRVRGFYSANEEIKTIESDEFVVMLLLDGFYILEVLLDAESENAAGKVDNPIYSTNWILPIIRLDMLLLENQLPFWVLQHLFQYVNGSNTSSLVSLAIQFFDHVIPIEREVPRVDSFHHLLDLFHWYLLPVTSPHSRITVEKVHKHSRSPPSIPSATEIQYPGIRLRGNWGASSIVDVKFVYPGVLEIPCLCINHSTNSIFRNLIAWEQCYPASGNYFTSYATFMDCLIDTPQDVVVLKNSGIIRHWFGTDEQVALLFNKLCIGITVNPASQSSLLDDLSVEVARFRMRKWARWRDWLMRNYFRNPWDIINYQFTAMTIIFTIVQTALAVVSLKRSS